ncbi:TonB family protein [Vacuolonema iberomarrocanum]|uniref:cell envelope integrity protein TolA n=1 Tax=Vacuolonema iberomarrocanum TaxID=3454632 RepID=UPI0019F234CD|nr:TonB family protein [filamentous cyanobacterium LEGE 07170]
MSLAKRYRTRFGAPRGDRLLLYLTTALAVHAGMATAGWVSWQEHQAESIEPKDSSPIEFIYLDDPDPTTEADVETNLVAQTDSDAAGTRVKDLPTNAGKVVTPANSLQDGKPVELVPETGQIQPSLRTPTHTASASSPIAAETTVSPETEEAKAVEATPEPLPSNPSLDGSIPSLPASDTNPSDGEVFSNNQAANSPDITGEMAASPDPPSTSAGPVVGDPLPSPPNIADGTEAGDGGSDEATHSSTESEDVEADATEGNVEATEGLEGTPNPDRTTSDDPAQIATLRDEELGEYTNNLTPQINAVWSRVEIQTSRSTVVRFIVNRSGELQSVVLEESSGLEAADQAALDAIRAASPFEPFPEAVDDEALSIRMEFHHIVNPEEDPSTDGEDAAGTEATDSTLTE